MVVAVASSSVVAGAAAVGTLPTVVAGAVGASPSGGSVLANSSSVCQFLVTDEQRATTSSVYETLALEPCDSLLINWRRRID